MPTFASSAGAGAMPTFASSFGPAASGFSAGPAPGPAGPAIAYSRVFMQSLNRPNLRFEVRHKEGAHAARKSAAAKGNGKGKGKGRGGKARAGGGDGDSDGEGDDGGEDDEVGGTTLQQIIALVQKHREQSGIVYCLTIKSCNQTAEAINKAIGHGTAAAYHGKLLPQERSETQDAWFRGEIPVVCATSESP